MYIQTYKDVGYTCTYIYACNNDVSISYAHNVLVHIYTYIYKHKRRYGCFGKACTVFDINAYPYRCNTRVHIYMHTHNIYVNMYIHTYMHRRCRCHEKACTVFDIHVYPYRCNTHVLHHIYMHTHDTYVSTLLPLASSRLPKDMHICREPES